MNSEQTFEFAGRRFDSGWLIAGAFFSGILLIAGLSAGFVMMRHAMSKGAPVAEPIIQSGAPQLTNSGASALPPPPPIPEKQLTIEDYTPQLAMTAGPKGAFVRSTPSKKGDQVTQLKPGTPLKISGRAKDTDHVWYRLTLDDGRTGFVRDDVVETLVDPNPGKKPAFSETVEDFKPQSPLAVGGGGARVRATPSLKAQALVVLPASTELSVTGRVDMQDHYWYRVKLADGRVGYVRDDVVTAHAAAPAAPGAPAPQTPVQLTPQQ